MTERNTKGDFGKEAQSSSIIIAEAFVRRRFAETRRVQRIFDEYTEAGKREEQPKDIEEIQIAAIASALAPFFDDSASFDFSGYFELENAIEKSRILATQAINPISGFDLTDRDTQKKLGDFYSATLPPYKERVYFIQRIRKGAQSVAEEKNIGEEKIYEDEELYAEVIRRSFTPEDAAKIYERMGKRFTNKLAYVMASVIGNHLKEMIISRLSVEERTVRNLLLIDSYFSPERVAEGAEFKKLTEDSLSVYNQGIYKLIEKVTLRFWGEAGIEQLPEEIRSKIPQ